MTKLFWFTVLANLSGAIYGFLFFYGDQLATTPFPWVLFVPDSPTYTLLFALCALMLWKRVRADWLLFLAGVGNVKVGIWAIFVLLYYGHFFLAPAAFWITLLLIATHIGMWAQSLLFINRLEVKPWMIALSLAWFGLSDYSDYFMGTHPILPTTDLDLSLGLSVALTLTLSIAGYLVYKNVKEIPFGFEERFWGKRLSSKPT